MQTAAQGNPCLLGCESPWSARPDAGPRPQPRTRVAPSSSMQLSSFGGGRKPGFFSQEWMLCSASQGEWGDHTPAERCRARPRTQGLAHSSSRFPRPPCCRWEFRAGTGPLATSRFQGPGGCSSQSRRNSASWAALAPGGTGRPSSETSGPTLPTPAPKPEACRGEGLEGRWWSHFLPP